MKIPWNPLGFLLLLLMLLAACGRPPPDTDAPTGACLGDACPSDPEDDGGGASMPGDAGPSPSAVDGAAPDTAGPRPSTAREGCGDPGIVCTTQDLDTAPTATLAGSVPVPPSLPAHAELQSARIPVTSQGTCGSCVAHAARNVMGLRAIPDLGGPFDASPSHIWFAAGYGASNCPRGSYVDRVVERNMSLVDGTVTRATWPYDDADPEGSLSNVPPREVLSERGIAYISDALTVSSGSVLEIKGAIAQGWPVLLAVAVHRNEGWRSSGVIDSPAGGEARTGFHAVALFGFDDASQTVRFMNSWSDRWGTGGYGTFSYRFLESNNNRGGYAIRRVSARRTPCPPDPDCTRPGWLCANAATSVECATNAADCLAAVRHACAGGQACDARTGRCACIPNCAGRLCGPDGCGGSCGAGCEAGYACTAAGRCEYTCPAGAFACPGAGAFCRDATTLATCGGPDANGCYDVSVVSCDDGDACTTDLCAPSGCRHERIAGCCSASSQCDDGNACTTDSCDARRCTNAPRPGSCPCSGALCTCQAGRCEEAYVDLCTDVGFGGPSGDTCGASPRGCLRLPVATGGALRVDNLGAWCSYNDQVSSVRLHGVRSVRLCEHNTLGGRCITLTESCSDLHGRNGITCGNYAGGGNIGDQATSVLITP